MAVGARPRGAGARRATCCRHRPTGAGTDERAARARDRLPARQPRARRGRARLHGRRCRRPACRWRPRRSSPEPPVEQRGAGPAAAEQRGVRRGRDARRRASPRSTCCASTPTQVREFAERVGEETLRRATRSGSGRGRPTSVPERWDASFDLVDEIWVYSTLRRREPRARGRAECPWSSCRCRCRARPRPARRCRFELPRRLPVPVHVRLLLDARAQEPARAGRGVHARVRARRGPELLLKTINARVPPRGARAPAPRDRRPRRHPARRRVRSSRESATRCSQRADCYVSLHRSEGFGLTLAESMALGKPVIATGYSGNTDFMTPANSYLVDWTLTEVGPERRALPGRRGSGPSPSLEHAAAHAARGLRRPRGVRRARRARRRRHRRLAEPRGGRRDRAQAARPDRPPPQGRAARGGRGAAPGRRLRAPARVRPQRRRPRRGEGRRAARAVPRAAPVHGLRARARPRARRRRCGGSRSSSTATAPPGRASRPASSAGSTRSAGRWRR